MGKPGDVLSIEPRELFRIEYSVRFGDSLERKGLNERFVIKRFLIVAGSPSEQRQKIPHRFGQDALLLIGRNGRCAVPFAESGLVGPKN